MKNYLKRVGAALLGLTLAIATLVGCGTKQTGNETQSSSSAAKTVYRTVDEIKESGTINIGVFSDKSPFGYVDENGEYQGYDVYFGNRIGKDLGVKINYISTEAANRIEYLQTGKVDACNLGVHCRHCSTHAIAGIFFRRLAGKETSPCRIWELMFCLRERILCDLFPVSGWRFESV